jgi:shikimate dehydrogenase
MKIGLHNNFKKLGVVGDPIFHSLSPLIHGVLLSGSPYIYLPYQIPAGRFGEFLRAAELLGFTGFNVTMPHKEAAYYLMDEVSPEARKSKSVNTVKLQNGKRLGFSTDGEGFLISLKEIDEPAGKNILILGSGGAARAVINALSNENVTVLNRTPKTGCAKLTAQNLKEYFSRCDIMINCTPLGMRGMENFSDFGFLDSSPKTVCDLIYNPLQTDLLKEAKLRGHKTLGGLNMLIYQAILASEIFTETKIDKSSAKQRITEVLEKRLTLPENADN